MSIFVKNELNMIKNRTLLAIVSVIILSGYSLTGNLNARNLPEYDFRKALELYENHMFREAKAIFDNIYSLNSSSQAAGYSILCMESLRDDNYEENMNEYISRYPYSGLLPEIYLKHALNLFDTYNYKDAVKAFEKAGEKGRGKKEQAEYYYKSGYCYFQIGNNENAYRFFRKVDAMSLNNYSAPSRFNIGLLEYQNRKFNEAINWFEKSEKDIRFKEASLYYILECKFMLKDYAYFIKNGEEIIKTIPSDRQPHLARMLSEAFLIKGMTAKAEKYYRMTEKIGEKNRDDYFYAGSLMYAIGNYSGAIDKFRMMKNRTDSLGQIANYQMAFSYIKKKNKVAAMMAFKDATEHSFNDEIKEDAFFNYAKLSFDLNNDPSVFEKYIKVYSDRKRGNRIYAYQALAALHNKDYAGAVSAYDKIDELDYDMQSNYMKANYLRAEQLIEGKSYRKAVPCLKAAAYYSEKNSPFNLLARYWLAESYYMDEKYDEAREEFNILYNLSALDGRLEGMLLPYNIAYCYFKKNNSDMSIAWFDKFLQQSVSGKFDRDDEYRRDAMIRKADALFMKEDYKAAIDAYYAAIDAYNGDSDLYPRYQAGIAYGLTGQKDEKIEALSPVMTSAPNAHYYPETLYELGRTYLDKEKYDDAILCYDKLLSTSKDSSFMARSLLGLGMAYRNKGLYDNALDYYKQVVSTMSSTGYSNDALAAIEAIYQEKQEPEQYLAYVESIGKLPEGESSDKEDMLFNGAERVFLAGNYSKALSPLISYTEKYPSGKHISDTYFYLAESYKNIGKKDLACDCYYKVMYDTTSAYAEVSALNYSNLCYELEKFNDAYNGYEVLEKTAKIESNKTVATIGKMRAAFKNKDYAKAVKAAEKVSTDQSNSGDIVREAEYIKAKSYLAMSEREKAFSILKKLAAHPIYKEGAEATYMIIMDSFDRGDFKDVEKKVFAFSDAKSGQTYWLAKSFIILGDSYAERENFRQARATFESIRDGYKAESPNDDVIDEVNMRLNKLKEMGK